MLVVWRRTGEGLSIGDNVEIEILDLRPNRVKLGIAAPETLSILRREAKITRDENVAAAISMDTHAIGRLLRTYTH